MGRENSRPSVDYEGDGLRKIRLGQGYGAGEGLFVVAKIRSEAMDAHSCLEEQHVRVDVQEGHPSPIPNNVSGNHVQDGIRTHAPSAAIMSASAVTRLYETLAGSGSVA